ncbi:hypothetical protein D3C76_830770 [compost metagenome]
MRRLAAERAGAGTGPLPVPVGQGGFQRAAQRAQGRDPRRRIAGARRASVQLLGQRWRRAAVRLSQPALQRDRPRAQQPRAQPGAPGEAADGARAAAAGHARGAAAQRAAAEPLAGRTDGQPGDQRNRARPGADPRRRAVRQRRGLPQAGGEPHRAQAGAVPPAQSAAGDPHRGLHGQCRQCAGKPATVPRPRPGGGRRADRPRHREPAHPGPGLWRRLSGGGQRLVPGRPAFRRQELYDGESLLLFWNSFHFFDTVSVQ